MNQREIEGKYLELLNKYREVMECYDIVLKTARRCVRDLRHVVDNVPNDNPMKEMFSERYGHYEVIFGGTTDYRIKLHDEIMRLDYKLIAEVNKNTELLKRLSEYDSDQQQMLHFNNE